MDSFSCLREDHAGIENQIQRLEEALFNLRYEGKGSLGKNLKQIMTALRFFNVELIRHMALEEKVLFPYLEMALPKLDSVIGLMRVEHQSLRKTMAEIRASLARLNRERGDTARLGLEILRTTGTYWIYLLRTHAEVENETIYRAMNRELHPGEKRELAKKIRQYEL